MASNEYIITMNANKVLIQTKRINLYQRESLVDKIKFLIPYEYGEYDLRYFVTMIKYVDAKNVAHSEILVAESELYNDTHIQYLLPVDTELSNTVGDITLYLTFTMPDLDNGVSYVLHTSETTISIQTVRDYFEIDPDKSLQYVDQTMIKMSQMIKEIGAVVSKCADNMVLTPEGLTLMSGGEAIGNVISMPTLSDNVVEAAPEGLIEVVL